MRLSAIFILISLLFSPMNFVEAKERGNVPFLQTRVARDKVTEGEDIVYEVVLYSPESSIAGVEPMSYPRFDGVDVRRSAPDKMLSETELDGKRYYTAVIDRYFLRFPTKGKFPLGGAAYKLGLNRRVEVYDPFWGPATSNKVEIVNLKAPDVTVKVSPLPVKGRTADFSGAVGDFEISASIPEGRLKSGEDMLLMVSVTGKGNLEGVAVPDIISALPEGIQFKSMTDNLSHFVKDGELGSELEIECILTPKKEGWFVIGNLSFNYFNTANGSYETIIAPPLEFEVESGLPGTKRPAVIMEI